MITFSRWNILEAPNHNQRISLSSFNQKVINFLSKNFCISASAILQIEDLNMDIKILQFICSRQWSLFLQLQIDCKLNREHFQILEKAQCKITNFVLKEDGGENLQYLTRFLQQNKRVKNLSLNQISDVALCSLLPNDSDVRCLRLEKCRLSRFECGRVRPNWSCIARLDFIRMKIDVSSMRMLLRIGLINLKYLNFDQSLLNNESIKELSKANFPKLVTLTLFDNYINDFSLLSKLDLPFLTNLIIFQSSILNPAQMICEICITDWNIHYLHLFSENENAQNHNWRNQNIQIRDQQRLFLVDKFPKLNLLSFWSNIY